MFFQKTFDILIIIIIIIIAIVHLLTVDKKMFHIIWAKRLINISQEKEKIIYLYKSVNVIFLLCLTFYQNFKSYYV